MDPLTNPVIILAASFLPLLIAVIKQAGLSSNLNAIIALISYIVAGVAAVAISGNPFTSENLTINITTFTVIGTAVYALVWKNLTLGADAPIEKKLQAATSIKK